MVNSHCQIISSGLKITLKPSYFQFQLLGKSLGESFIRSQSQMNGASFSLFWKYHLPALPRFSSVNTNLVGQPKKGNFALSCLFGDCPTCLLVCISTNPCASLLKLRYHDAFGMLFFPHAFLPPCSIPKQITSYFYRIPLTLLISHPFTTTIVLCP